MRIMRLAIVLSVLMLVLPSGVVLAQAPLWPHAFYGSVQVYTEDDMSDITDAPEGMVVTAEVGGDPKGSLPVTTAGKYGGPCGGCAKLTVQGDIGSGSEILFYVDGYLAEEVRVKEEGEDWKDVDPEYVATFTSGEFWGLDLRAKVPVIPPEEPPPTGDGGAPPLPLVLETDLFGELGESPISEDGVVLETVTGTSADGILSLTLFEGTTALDANGDPLSILTVDVEPSPPDPPEGTYLLGAYDFGPDGATFNPPLELTWSVDPETLPEGMDWVIAYYDEGIGEWVYLPVELVNNTLTALVSSFTTFALIAVPAELPPVVVPAAFTVSSLGVLPSEVAPGEEVNISVLVANIGGESGSYTVVLEINGVKEAEESVTVPAGDSRDVSFTVSKEDVDSYSVVVDGLSDSFTVVAPPPEVKPPEVKPPEVKPPEVRPPFNWPLIGGIIGGVIVVGLLVYFLVVRRRAY